MTGLTARQICGLVTRITGTVGQEAQAGQYLNVVLNELCNTGNYLNIQRTIIAQLGVAPPSTPSQFNLPADYLRISGRPFYSINGTICWIDPLPQYDLDILPQSPGINNYPRWFDTDLSPLTLDPPQTGVMTFWPPSGFALDITIKYFPLMPDIAAPETSVLVPWFLDQKHLIMSTCGMMALHADDTRWEAIERRAEALLGRYDQMKDDQQGFAQTVKLDARRFKSWDNLKVTKQTGW